jgi:hypothetical protein
MREAFHAHGEPTCYRYECVARLGFINRISFFVASRLDHDLHFDSFFVATGIFSTNCNSDSGGGGCSNRPRKGVCLNEFDLTTHAW